VAISISPFLSAIVADDANDRAICSRFTDDCATTMGITIAYRGRLADLTRIEDFEDRLLDLALELGGQAQIWRSHADHDPQRMVRGVIVNLAPGQESTSLLLSPEGWLIGLTDIQDAELGRLTEPPWCFTKTQFGSLDGHVALVEMFATLRREFLPDLEISDEGGYYPTRDLSELARRRSLVQRALDGMALGLAAHGLSQEAAEDPDILLRRIERIAAQVNRILQRPPEHPPIAFPEEEPFESAQDPEGTEALWDEMYKHNRRQQEWLQRSLEERRSRGEADDESFERALEDLGLEIPGEEPGSADEPWRDGEEETLVQPFDGEETPDDAECVDGGAKDDPFADDDERDPLLQDAMDLLHELHVVFRNEDPRWASSLQTLFQGAGDAMGGLAQALSGRADGIGDHGLRVVQLKRALRGAVFARGALFSLRAALSAEQGDELHRRLTKLGQDIFHELARVRAEHRQEDS
jgi:hypothetical protein